MAIAAITIEEAFLQGSSWSQMLSIATFHERSIKLELSSISPDRWKSMPDWRARSLKKTMDLQVNYHRMTADYFKDLAVRMKKITEEIVVSGGE